MRAIRTPLSFESFHVRFYYCENCEVTVISGGGAVNKMDKCKRDSHPEGFRIVHKKSLILDISLYLDRKGSNPFQNKYIKYP